MAATKPSYKTSELTEETNLFFTDARAVAACAGTYLPLSGGIIDSGASDTPLVVKSKASTTWIKFESSDNASRYLGVGNSNSILYLNDSGAFSLYHAGNFNPSDYLPLTGGTMSGRLKLAGAGTAWLTFEAPNGNTAYGSIGVANDHTAVFNDGISTKTLIHSGNIGSQSVASATKLATARTIWGQSFDGTGDVDGVFTTSEDFIIDTTKYSDVYWARGICWRQNGYELGNLCYTAVSDRRISIVHGAYNSRVGLHILSNVNVIIVTTSDNGAKLQVV